VGRWGSLDFLMRTSGCQHVRIRGQRVSLAKLKARGMRSRIHQRASRKHPLSKAQENANHQKSKVRARIEHVFGAQQTSPGGRIARTIGIVRAKAKIGLQPRLQHPPARDAGADGYPMTEQSA
jgi:hypothetical protein